MWMNLVWVALGGAVGSAARYGVAVAGEGWPAPWQQGTWLVNWVGSFLMGVLAARPELSAPMRIGLGTGFLGGLTTYSTFNQQSVALIREGKLGVFALHAGLTVVGAIIAGAVGMWLGDKVR